MIQFGLRPLYAEKLPMVFIIFAVLRDRKPFELRTPEQHAGLHRFIVA